ncbi:MAG: hypothetical protein ACM3ZS_08180 [Nitrososphaerota archaeon]
MPIKDTVEKENIGSLLRNKKWNPYCLRHSSISSDSDYLPVGIYRLPVEDQSWRGKSTLQKVFKF